MELKFHQDGNTGRLVFTDESGNFALATATGFDAAKGSGGRGLFQDANGGMVLDMRTSGGNIFSYNTIKLNGNVTADNLELVFGANFVEFIIMVRNHHYTSNGNIELRHTVGVPNARTGDQQSQWIRRNLS